MKSVKIDVNIYFTLLTHYSYIFFDKIYKSLMKIRIDKIFKEIET